MPLNIKEWKKEEERRQKKVIGQVCLTAEPDVSILGRQVKVLEGVFSSRAAGKALPQQL